MGDGVVLFHDYDKVHVGGVCRYEIELDTQETHRSLFLRVRNTELGAMRAAYLNGPFTLYVDVMPMDYSELVPSPIGAEPKYENHLKAGSHFSAELKVLRRKQRWKITIMSEILFSRNVAVNFEIIIATTKAASKLHGRRNIQKHLGVDELSSHFMVNKLDTAAIWQAPLPRPDEPLHLCVLTHGLVSNVTADMLYIKELLDEAADRTGENLICKGYTGNVCRTERGVKYLGKRVAEWIIHELIPTYQPAKLSFIAHSLGGPIQTYALGYIQATSPETLKNIELVNFIALASPFLGIANENPGYVQFALDFGVVGKTGRDLGLSWTPGKSRPLLERLPNQHTLEVLRRFQHRTIYANAVHDGIVPLRTASLLYLDYRALGEANAAEHSEEMKYRPHLRSHHKTHHTTNHDPPKSPQSIDSNTSLQSARSESSTNSNTFTSFLFGEGRLQKKLERYQTVSASGDGDTVVEQLPKKTSLIESGMQLLLPPHPDTSFITDPNCRGNVLLHDRIYYQQDLPERRYKTRLSLVKGRQETVEVGKTDEHIARRYHDGLSWRKVLVQLLPEAHNNIIVRRRFSNAYGWPVIHHVVREHFLFPAARDSHAEEITEGMKSSRVERENDMPWSDSEDEKDADGRPPSLGTDHDPQRTSMLKIIPTRS